MKKSLVFDWTGTLVDEYDLDGEMCRNMERQISRKSGVTMEEAHRRYEDLLRGFRNSWEWFNYPLHGDLLKIDWRRAHIRALPKIRIIPDVIDVLAYYRRKGYCICILTNAVKEVMDARVDFLRIRSYFDLIITSDVVKATKTEGKHLDLALKSIYTPAGGVYAIGDSLRQDILPAKRLGLTTIQCRFGDLVYYHTENHDDAKEDLACTPDYVISSITSLLSIIE
jgi:putative hydrolase of the HAD superfamily